jgi:hypothetical protein
MSTSHHACIDEPLLKITTYKHTGRRTTRRMAALPPPHAAQPSCRTHQNVRLRLSPRLLSASLSRGSLRLLCEGVHTELWVCMRAQACTHRRAYFLLFVYPYMVCDVSPCLHDPAPFAHEFACRLNSRVRVCVFVYVCVFVFSCSEQHLTGAKGGS